MIKYRSRKNETEKQVAGQQQIIQSRFSSKALFFILFISCLLVHSLFGQVPVIASFTPTSGTIGTTVTITGTNFDTTPANNLVFFGATQATVTTASATSLTVTVPVGATYQPITVNVGGLIGYSAIPFTVTFPGGGGINTSSFASVDFTTGTNPASCSIGDLDGDGKADLVVTNSSSNTVSVFRNTSSICSISYAANVDFITGTFPHRVSIGDLDGDGKADLAVVNNASNTVSVFRNTSNAGSISFDVKVDFATGTQPYTVSIGDLDGDGKADLAVVNYINSTVSVFRNTGSVGNISYAAKVDFTTGGTPFSASIGDLDGDGKADLAVVNQGSNTVSVLLNTSSVGSISYATKIDFATGSSPQFVSIGDLDGDSKSDLAVASSQSSTVSVFRNTSSVGSISYATKVDFATGIIPISISIGDLDGDGKADLAVANLFSGTVSLFLNTSSAGSISYAAKADFTTGATPYSVSIGDIDGDGKVDLAVVNYNSNTVSVFRNTIGSGSPPTIASFTPTFGAIGASVTITGSNFDTTPANNMVSFNGTAAVLTASTFTSIATLVPVGASTGLISIQVGCVTALSALPFTVTGGASIIITTQPSDFIVCDGEIATFNTLATGTTNITYQWQKFNGTAFTDVSNGIGYTGATSTALTINTTGNFGAGDYRCKISGDSAADVFTNSATLTVNPIPSAPSSPVGASFCGSGSVTVSVSGGASGQYRWYTLSTGGTAISGEVNSSYTTSTISVTTTYYVAINNGVCESLRTPVTASIDAAGCSPVIPSQQFNLPIEGKVEVDLTKLITLTGTLDISSIKVLTQPQSGTQAIVTNGVLIIDYKGKPYVGKESVTIEACSAAGYCSQQTFTIEVVGDIIVYNALSPNGDGLNDFLRLQYIEVLPNTKNNQVLIYNRWGDEVFKMDNYNNADRIFKGDSNTGSKLPSGTYFYKIFLSDVGKIITGFISLKY